MGFVGEYLGQDTELFFKCSKKLIHLKEMKTMVVGQQVEKNLIRNISINDIINLFLARIQLEIPFS